MACMLQDPDRCYAAVSARDARFDGRFVVGVTSTGIFCRPACPARTPRRDRVRFFADPAGAVGAGFRACRRCLPDAVPGSPEWDLRADLAGRAMRLIADGVVDREGVAGLADRLGYTARHVHRVLVAEVGAGPVALARVRRAHAARVLLELSELPVTRVAFAAGFTGVRQCNETVRSVYATTPTGLRGRRRAGAAGDQTGAADPRHAAVLELRIPVRQPFAAAPLLALLAARAVPGVEDAAAGVWRRVLDLPRGAGVAVVSPRPEGVRVALRLEDPADLGTATTRLRRLLDLDADPVAVDDHLAGDPALAPLVARYPGLRAVGTGDGDEAVIRAVLAQQVSTAAARTLAGRLVALAGAPLPTADGGLTHRFPTAAAIAEADLDGLGMPGARVRTLRGVATALADGTVRVDPGADRTTALAALGGLPGVGPWTVAVAGLRALRDPDVWPATDLALLRAAARLGLPGDAKALARHAERWAPWRGYAATHLWASLA